LRESSRVTYSNKEEEVPNGKRALKWEADGSYGYRAELKPVGFILNVFLRDGHDKYGFEVMDADCSTLRLHQQTSALSLEQAFIAAESAAVDLLLEALAVFPCEAPCGFSVIEKCYALAISGPLGSFKASSANAIALARTILRSALKKP
jgi:hypothetical protein